jgi:hypothetical protein
MINNLDLFFDVEKGICDEDIPAIMHALNFSEFDFGGHNTNTNMWQGVTDIIAGVKIHTIENPTTDASTNLLLVLLFQNLSLKSQIDDITKLLDTFKHKA